MGQTGTQHWLGHLAFRFSRVLIWGVCIARLVWPELDKLLVVFSPLMIPQVVLPGIIMMLCGFALTLTGHFTLGVDWTSGVNPDGPQSLTCKGVYGVSRNPMFLGVLITQAGFVLALPSGFTLLCLVIGYAAVLNQVKLEERYLKQRFGQVYLKYLQKVPRWLGTLSGIRS